MLYKYFQIFYSKNQFFAVVWGVFLLENGREDLIFEIWL